MLNKDNLNKFKYEIKNTTKGFKMLQGLYIIFGESKRSGLVVDTTRASAKVYILSTKQRHITITNVDDIIGIYKVFTCEETDYYIPLDAKISQMIGYVKNIMYKVEITKKYNYNSKFEGYTRYLKHKSKSKRIHRLVDKALLLVLQYDNTLGGEKK